MMDFKIHFFAKWKNVKGFKFIMTKRWKIVWKLICHINLKKRIFTFVILKKRLYLDLNTFLDSEPIQVSIQIYFLLISVDWKRLHCWESFGKSSHQKVADFYLHFKFVIFKILIIFYCVMVVHFFLVLLFDVSIHNNLVLRI